MTGFLHVGGADIACVAPELVLAAFATLILLLDAFARPIRAFFPYVTLLGLALANLAGSNVPGLFFGGAVESSGLTRFIELVACGAVALAVLGGAASLERDRRNQGEFYALLLFAAAGTIVMVRGVDLLVVFLGLELMSLSLYVLAAWYRDVPAATEAALKYFLMGALASAFLLYGIATIYGRLGTTAPERPPGPLREQLLRPSTFFSRPASRDRRRPSRSRSLSSRSTAGRPTCTRA